MKEKPGMLLDSAPLLWCARVRVRQHVPGQLSEREHERPGRQEAHGRHCRAQRQEHAQSN